MKKFFLLGACLMFCVGIGAVSDSAFAQADNSINVRGVGLLGADIAASVGFLEYERVLKDNLAVFGRIGQLSYEYDDDVYVEEGDGPGFEAGIRFYPSGEGMKGFYLGGSLGYWDTEWDWIDDQGEPYETRGSGSSTAINATFELGGRFNLGSESVSLIPSAHIGNFFSVEDECVVTQGPATACDSGETELGLYAVVGLALGFAW